jgi:sterol desaturase/sphingolipid hydroxylase (fatty acid hydroxylase superfamily)
MRRHVTFTPRDYLILLLINAPLFLAVEWLTALPIALGASLAVLAYLGIFDTLHWMFHVPQARFIERMWFFRALKQLHRLHHRYQTRNLNVVLPLADLVFRTRAVPKRTA